MGYAKRIFQNYINEQTRFWGRTIREDILPIMPIEYSTDSVYKIIKEYYFFELRAFQFQLDGYAHQDKVLKKRKNMTRYSVKSVSYYIFSGENGYLFLPEYKALRAKSYSEEKRKTSEDSFVDTRKKKNDKKRQKVEEAKKRAQGVEPIFLDKMLGLYDRKTTSQKDRVYILNEIKKYDCKKVTDFLQRLLAHEQNFQLREMALHHLQSYGYEPRLRSNDGIPFNTRSKQKKKAIREYKKLRYTIEGVPEELSYQINNSSVQKLKSYDYFISHSFQDHDAVQRIINEANSVGKNVYCDWISDSDYLKRNLVCDATLAIIEKRINEAKEILFVDSSLSRSSKWVAHELQYAVGKGKPIRRIEVNASFSNGVDLLEDLWFTNVTVGNLI